MPLIDTDLIKQTKNGSIEAFEKIVRSYQQYVYRIAYGLLGNEGNAEDVVQEAFITVLIRLRDYAVMKLLRVGWGK